MRRYRNKIKNSNNHDSEEEKAYPSYEYPSYQISRQYEQKEFPQGYQNSQYISQKMQYNDPYGKTSKISSKSEKYYKIYTESSPQKVNFEGKKTAKKYMNKRAYTPSHISKNYAKDEYISELREEYSNPILNNRVNIRKKIYRGNQTPTPYRTNEYQEYNNEEEYLDNYGFHETKDIKNKGYSKYDSITHITGYSNLIPLNRLKQCGRIETYNYSQRKEQENQTKFKDAIEKVRELQRGKREYDEFMRKLGANDVNEDRFENYKKEQLKQQEIREEKIRTERIRQQKIREEKIRQEKIRIERIKKEEESKKEKIKKDQIKQEELRQKKIREEKIRQEKIKQQEKLKQERIKQQEKIKDKSKQKSETYKKIVINTQTSNARSDSITKRFKAHSGKYTYKDNIDEEIDQYRNNTNYNKEQKNTARKEIIYKNTKKEKNNQSYSKLPIKININTSTKSYSRNQSSKNLKTITDYSIKNKNNQSYQIKTTKETSINNSIREGARKNSYRSNKTNITSNYTKNNYVSNNYPNKSSNNYKRSMLKISEKTESLNYPNPHIKPDYPREPYHRDYVNIENVSHCKIANHIHTGLSKDGQYLISMTSAEKISDENELYELPEKNVEEIISTVREKKKNLGDNYAFYESKHLLKPDNSSYTIHKRFGERTIYGKEKYETRKVRHYKIKSGEESKYYDINDNDINDYDQDNNMIEYRDCGYGCVNRYNQNMEMGDEYENIDYNYSPDSPEGQDIHEGEYENRVEEYNYESY